jgi:hypothetical protein
MTNPLAERLLESAEVGVGGGRAAGTPAVSRK